MAANILTVAAFGAASVLVTALFSLLSDGFDPTLLLVALAFGILLGGLMVWRLGGSENVWRNLKSPPR